MSIFNELDVVGDFYGVTTTKGDIMINDGLKNNRLPIGANNFILVSDTTQPFGLKWSDKRITTTQTFLVTLPISTNSTTPAIISEFTLTPNIGKYIIFYNITFAMSAVISRTTVFGIYVNNVLSATSSRTSINSVIGMYNTITMQFMQILSGTDIITIRYNVSNVDTTTDIIYGSLLLTKFSPDLV